MAKRVDRLMEILRNLNDLGDELFTMDRRGHWKNVLGSYPSEVKRNIDRLEKKGWVSGRQITDKGRKQVMLHLLEQVDYKGKKWDGKWKVIFFDIPTRQRKKRDQLRGVLHTLGCHELQESVYISPFVGIRELKYMKEALGLEEEVRLGILESIDGEEELRGLFKISSDGNGQE